MISLFGQCPNRACAFFVWASLITIIMPDFFVSEREILLILMQEHDNYIIIQIYSDNYGVLFDLGDNT